MSRIDAALRRAKTGIADPQPPVRVEHVAAFTAPATINAPVTPAEASAVEASPAELRKSGEIVRATARAIADRRDDASFHGFNPEHAEKLVLSDAMPQPMRETYRRVAATLHHAQADHKIKILMVSSAVPNEGKTLTATNIALTLSESFEQRVLLIDADLRRPSLHDIFRVPRGPGLHEALASVPDRSVPVINVSQHLSLLTGGAPDPDPMSMLTSGRMRRLLAEAAGAFDWVIIDTPPVGILTDAKLLGAIVDAALLVVRAGSTPSSLVQRAVEALGRERIIGVILNRTEVRHATGAYSYYNDYSYDYSPEGER